MAATPPLHAPNVESQSAYREALARAEAEAAPYIEPSRETPAEGGQEEAATPTTAAPEVATPAAPEATEPQAAPEQPAETPETPETPAATETDPTAARIAELEAQLAEREARIAEQQTFIGRQTTEVGDVRREIDELRQRLEAPAQPQAPQVPITQELIDENPAYATQLAFEQKNEQALQLAYENWKLDDPATAGVWLAERRFEQRLAERDAAHQQELEQLKTAIQPAQERHQQEADQAVWAQAFDLTRQAHPDFVEHAERILTDVAPQYPHLVTILADGEPAARAEALKVLYQIDAASRLNPAAVKEQLESEAAAAAQEAAASAAAAAVVAGQTTTSANTPARELTPEEREQQAYMRRFAGPGESWDAQMKGLTSPRT